MTTNNAINLKNASSNSQFPQVTIAAWAVFNGNGSGTPTVNGSYNVTSITQGSEGDYTITMTNALGSANYAVVASAGNGTSSSNLFIVSTNNLQTPTATTFGMIVRDQSGSRQSPPYISFMVIGT